MSAIAHDLEHIWALGENRAALAKYASLGLEIDHCTDALAAVIAPRIAEGAVLMAEVDAWSIRTPDSPGDIYGTKAEWEAFDESARDAE